MNDHHERAIIVNDGDDNDDSSDWLMMVDQLQVTNGRLSKHFRNLGI